MQAIQFQCLKLALGIERECTVQLQRIRIAHPQPLQIEGTALYIGVQAKLHRVSRQFRVERTQQQLAPMQAGIKVDRCRAASGIETEPTVAVHALPSQRTSRGIEADAIEGELPG